MDDTRTSAARHFPPVSEALYTQFPPASYGIKESRGIRRFFGSGPAHRFGRILSMHRKAFEAELNGVWDRATFYWNELHRVTLASRMDDVCWAAGRAALFGEALDEPSGPFRSEFLRDMVIESHAGFFAGQVDAGVDPVDRPKFHLEALSRLLKLQLEITVAEEGSLINPLAAMAIDHYTRCEMHDKHEKIEALWLLLADCFPRQTQYVEAATAEIYNGMKNRLNEADDSMKLATIEIVISRSERLRSKFPKVFACYQLLGVLFHEQAILMANSDRIPDAFLAATKAEIFGGSNAAVGQTQQQLEQILAAMREAAERILKQVHQTPGASLSARGQQLVGDAQTGGTHADSWSKSPAAEQIRQEREQARQATRAELASDCPTPFIHIERVSKAGGEEEFEDWLVSPAARRVKTQIVAAALLFLVTTGLMVRELCAVHARGSAWRQAELGLSIGNDTIVLDALADFFAALAPLRADPQSDARTVRVYADSLMRWLNAKRGGLSPEDMHRVQRYREQIVDKNLDLHAR